MRNNYLIGDKFSNIKAHPFHLVDSSPWPFLTSFGVLGMAFSGVLYMHSFVYGGYLFLVSLVSVLFVVSLWWRDVVREATFQGHHTRAVKTGLRMGMKLFILSEVFFFVALFWAFFSSALAPTVSIGAVWPPIGIQLFNPSEVPLLNTIILLSSGVTITWAHKAVCIPTKEYTRDTKVALGLTILLGLIFTFFQGVEYLEAPFSINDGIYGSVFFLTTGFHGIHVIIGTLFLIVNFIRLLRHHFTYDDHVGFESAIWYWHFVDVVWLFVYLFLYSHCFCWLYVDYFI